MAGDDVPLPLQPHTRMGAAPAAGDADLRHRLYLCRPAGICWPNSERDPRTDRLGPRRLLVSRCRHGVGRRRALHLRALSLCLPRGARGVPGPVPGLARRQPHSRSWAAQHFSARRPAARPAGDRGRRRTRPAGDAGRLRHRAILRRPHLHHGDLPGVVRHGRRRRRSADRHDPAADCRRLAAPGASQPRSRPLPCCREHSAPIRALFPVTAARLGGGGAVRPAGAIGLRPPTFSTSLWHRASR
jgi:hypothetical protein